MSFRLVPNSVTLNDLERRNSPNCCVISPNSVDFWANYVKVVEDTPVLFFRGGGEETHCTFKLCVLYFLYFVYFVVI